MTIIDRLENDFAVLEIDGIITEIQRCLIPDNAREGDILIRIDEKWNVDVYETEKRRAEMREFMKRLMKK